MKSILLLGDSVWFDALAANLSVTQEINIVRADPTAAQAFIAPAAIDLVVMEESHIGEMPGLLRIYPTAAVLAVNLATGSLTALHGQSWVARSFQDVAQTVRDMTFSAPPLTGRLFALPRRTEP